MRLGDLDEALRMINDSRTDNPFFNGKTAPVWEMAHDCAISCVAACSTIDAVPVVRCKDCKHWDEPYCMLCKTRIGAGYLSRDMAYRKPDDFCSYGERKDGDG